MRDQGAERFDDALAGLFGAHAFTRGPQPAPTIAMPAGEAESFAAAKPLVRSLSDADLHELASVALREHVAPAAAVEVLTSRLDGFNRAFMSGRDAQLMCGPDVVFDWVPVQRVGIYVPWRYPITAITYLSAARAAGVPEIVVYLAEDRREGRERPICSLSALICKLYGVNEVLAGPARVAFLSLTFPGPLLAAGCDLLCGPANRGLNASKQICGIVGRASVELFAGPSEFVAVCDSTADWQQVLLDLNAQREHGATSVAHLVLVGDAAFGAWSASGFENECGDLGAGKGRFVVHRAASIEDTVRLVEDLAPETLELWVRDAEAVAHDFRSVGVLYVRSASSLGDYGVLGRGCADPTDGRARSQSGVSPQTFLRLRPIVSPQARASADVLAAAATLAEYEGGSGFPWHARAIRGS